VTVRLRLALTIFFTGALSALGVSVALAFAFERFEHERTYDRANAFLDRVLMNYDDMLELQARKPDEFVPWLKSLLLFEPDTQLYLLTSQGRVLASTGRMQHGPDYRVALAAVQQAAGKARAPYVMGDDPEHMAKDAVIAARALRRAVIRPGDEVAGYLYLVAQQPRLEGGRMERLRAALAAPAALAVLAVIAVATLMAAWMVSAVTRPLQRLSQDVARAAREGFNAVPEAPPQHARRDEFGQLHEGFAQLLATLRQQWSSLREMDQFRREGVSNLSHDLRSPLTATIACLETLQQRWQGQSARDADRELVDVALRNTRNAAGLVRSLGDLALLDEPSFKLDTMVIDVGEVLDDIVLRFADRAAQQGITLTCEARGVLAPIARVDVELFERAVANLVDNALKFTPAAGSVTLASLAQGDAVHSSVHDSGSGIAAADLPRLFDRLFQAREHSAPAGSEGGKGLGLAIVKRIAELHGGSVSVTSDVGRGTEVTLTLPRA
jgi:signal transduction histidine kinase